MDPDSFPEDNDPETYAIIGVAMEVHRELGPGFLEPVYQQALALELDSQGIPYQKEVPLTISYKKSPLDCTYRADFICHDSIIIELKAVESLTAIHHAQVLNYLKATNFTRALLLNFASRSLQHQRFTHTPTQKKGSR